MHACMQVYNLQHEAVRPGRVHRAGRDHNLHRLADAHADGRGGGDAAADCRGQVLRGRGRGLQHGDAGAEAVDGGDVGRGEAGLVGGEAAGRAGGGGEGGPGGRREQGVEAVPRGGGEGLRRLEHGPAADADVDVLDAAGDVVEEEGVAAGVAGAKGEPVDGEREDVHEVLVWYCPVEVYPCDIVGVWKHVRHRGDAICCCGN